MAVNSVEEFSIAVQCIGARRRKVREIFFFFLSFLDCDIYFLPYHILHCQCQLLCTTCWLCHSSFRSLHAPDRVRSFYFLHTPSTWGELSLKVYWLELDWVWERVAQVDVWLSCRLLNKYAPYLIINFDVHKLRSFYEKIRYTVMFFSLNWGTRWRTFKILLWKKT